MEHSSFDAETSAITRSYRQYWRRVFGDISDCGVGITPQMCNRVTNHGDMSTFSKPAPVVIACDKMAGLLFNSTLNASARNLA